MINIDNHLKAIEKMIKDATLPGRHEKAVKLYEILSQQSLDTESAVKAAKDLLHGAKSSRQPLTELIYELEAPPVTEQADLGIDDKSEAHGGPSIALQEIAANEHARKAAEKIANEIMAGIRGPIDKVDNIVINDRPISDFVNIETTEQTLAKVVINILSEAFRNPSETVSKGIENSIKTIPEHGRYNCGGKYIPPQPYKKVEGVGPDQPVVTNTRGGRLSDTPYYFNDIDPQAMLLIGERSGHGLKKYGPLNWQRISSQEHLNHALTHIYAYMAGDRSDPIAGGHLSGAGWRVIAALGQALRGR